MARSIRSFATRQFDSKLESLQRAAAELRQARPQKGWLHSLRYLLGMSTRSAASRIGISHSTLLKLEEGERRGSITLNSLRKTADALDAELVYALVPRTKLQEVISGRARAIATGQVLAVAGTMALEDQGISKEQIERQIEELAHELEQKMPREFWSER